MSLLLDELLKKFSRGEQRIAPGGDPIIRDLTPSLNGDFIVLAVLPEQPTLKGLIASRHKPLLRVCRLTLSYKLIGFDSIALLF